MGRIHGHRFRRTTLLLMLFMGVVAGIGTARMDAGFPAALCWCAGLVTLVSWRTHGVRALCACLLLGLCLGWWRGSVYGRELSVYQEFQYKKVTLSARAMEDAVYDDKKQLTFYANDIRLDDGTRLPGRIKLGGFGAGAVFQGDEVSARGKLYPGYGISQGSIGFAKITVTAHHPTLIGGIRRRFAAGMQTALPEPLAPFAMGLLVGQRANLPDGVKDDLLRVGLTHIIAVSGYNLTIILHASRRLLGKRSKRISTFLSLTLIGGFLLLAGASASIVRAAIVSVLSVAAGYYGRAFKPLNLILMTAAVTAWANPVYVWSDLSWYLSFLAFFGVMVVSPLAQARWPAGWHRSLMGSVALESVCASVMTEPFILYVFNQMSLISLPANMLVVALIPLAMLLGAVAGLAGMLAPVFAGWLSWPAALLMNYMLDTAHLLAGLPHTFVEHRSLPLAGMLGAYALVAAFALTLRHKTNKLENATITDKNERSQQMVHHKTAEGG